MVKKVTVTLVDDLDNVPASETVMVGLDGSWYEIDLSDSNADLLRKQMGQWIIHARKVTRRQRTGSSGGQRDTASAPRTRGAADRARSAAIRDWAREQGFEISARGRISSEVVRAYENAE